MLIPSTFLAPQAVHGAEGLSSAFVNRTGTWLPRRSGAPSTLRFQIPQAVLPLDPVRARLRLRINAASRSVDIQTGYTGSLVELTTEMSPVGVYEYNIDNPDALALDDAGGLHVRIVVGDLKARSQISSGRDEDWKIDFMELQLEGRYVGQ